MRTLIAVAYPNETQASEERVKFLKMQKSYLVDLEDAVVVTRKQDGKVKLHQLFNLTATGALSGGSSDEGGDRQSRTQEDDQSLAVHLDLLTARR